MTPVGELDNRAIGTGDVGEVTHALSESYLGIIRGDNPKYSHWTTAIVPGGG